MNADRKLARLLRLERVRAIARQAAASEAARAESTLAQLQALAARSEDLLAGYKGRADAVDGSDLRRLAMLASGLQGVCRKTGADAARARVLADQRQDELASAERRRAAVEDRAAAVRRQIRGHAAAPALDARRKPGVP